MSNCTLPLDRGGQLARLREDRLWDLVVIGGGASGLGVAVDAAARGFKVALVEAHDFAKGTSSRATKLVHGGVRYLAQGNIALVREALRERATLLTNAPHLAQPVSFVMPAFRWWETAFYGTGLKLYDALAGARSLGATRLLSARETKEALTNLRSDGLKGGVLYWDAQFDDARLAIALARTAVEQGAAVVNACEAVELLRDARRVCGVVVRDQETGVTLRLKARCVVNATGVWVDSVRDLDRSAEAPRAPRMVSPSQGAHLVVDRKFLPGDKALLIPKTQDGRVLFAVPWLGKIILGTTDTPRNDIVDEPVPLPDEVDFVLRETGRYLTRAPQLKDVRSAWAGLRPLVQGDADAGNTKAISREHTVRASDSGLVTVTGGKWTTYRAMAEDVLDLCFERELLERRPGGVTLGLRLAGAPDRAAGNIFDAPGIHLYGRDAIRVGELPGASRWLWQDGRGGLTEAMVRFAARHEMARTVEDVLARRSRLLFLDAERAEALARPVAAILAEELDRSLAEDEIAAFEALARRYADPLCMGMDTEAIA